MITASQIKQICPNAKPALVAAIVENWAAAEKAGITTTLRKAHFFAQIATETGGLRAVEESLNYTSAARIRSTWPSRFKTDKAAEPFVKKPMALAIKVYGGRMGNKPEPSKDGWDFRGGGMMQTTGRENYAKMGFENNPDALRDPKTAFLTAVREWVNRGCNALADKDDIRAVRKSINGGTIGLKEATEYLAKAKSVFAAPAPKPVANPDLSIAEIRELQTKLYRLGYTEVGMPDGRFGSRSRSAVLAYEADNELPLTGKPTFEILLHVASGKKREISATRANATATELMSNPAVKHGSTLSGVGKSLIAATGVGAAIDSVADIEKITESVNKVNALVDTLMNLSPWVIGLVAGGIVLYFGRKIVSNVVEDFREGRLL